MPCSRCLCLWRDACIFLHAIPLEAHHALNCASFHVRKHFRRLSAYYVYDAAALQARSLMTNEISTAVVDAATDVTPLGRDQGLLESTAQQFIEQGAGSSSVGGAESLRHPGTKQVSFAYTSTSSPLHFWRKQSCANESSQALSFEHLMLVPLVCRARRECVVMGCCNAAASPAFMGIRAGASVPLSASLAVGRLAMPYHLAA